MAHVKCCSNTGLWFISIVSFFSSPPHSQIYLYLSSEGGEPAFEIMKNAVNIERV